MSKLLNINTIIEEISRRDTTDGTIKVFSGKEIIEILRSLPSETVGIDCDRDPNFKSCCDCVHDDDTEDICKLRNCVHAIAYVEECYKPKRSSIIHCKDCKHMRDLGESVYICESTMSGFISPYWYCSQAERGEE